MDRGAVRDGERGVAAAGGDGALDRVGGMRVVGPAERGRELENLGGGNVEAGEAHRIDRIPKGYLDRGIGRAWTIGQAAGDRHDGYSFGALPGGFA